MNLTTLSCLMIKCVHNQYHSFTHFLAQIDEDIAGEEYADSPLDAITLGVLEARSFLFKYDEDDDEENKENDKKKKNSKGLQRSQASVQQSPRLSSKFVFPCCTLPQLLNTQKNVPYHLNLHINLQF